MARTRKYKQIKLTKREFMFEEDRWNERYNKVTYKLNTKLVG